MVSLNDVEWRSGFRAYCHGFPLDYCPFERYSEAWHLWISGYSAAEFNTEH